MNTPSLQPRAPAAACVLLVLGLAFVPRPTIAQIPVTDLVSFGQRVVEFGLNAGRWVQQAEQMYNQYLKMKETVEGIEKTIEQADQLYEALSGERSLGSIIDSDIVRDWAPDDWRAAARDLMDDGFWGIDDAIDTLVQDSRVFDKCGILEGSPEEHAACEFQAADGSIERYEATEAYDRIVRRDEVIEDLRSQIYTGDHTPKEMEALQARLAVEIAGIQNESNKLSEAERISSADQKINDRRRTEINARAFSSPVGIVPPDY